jgi:hypothetical protein
MCKELKNGIPILMSKTKNKTLKRQHKRHEDILNGKNIVLSERELYVRQNGCCFYCFNPMSPAPYSKKYLDGWTRDHFYPKMFNNHLESNMVLACRTCNKGKDNDAPLIKEMDRFRAIYLLEKDLGGIFGTQQTKKRKYKATEKSPYCACQMNKKPKERIEVIWEQADGKRICREEGLIKYYQVTCPECGKEFSIVKENKDLG